MVSKRSSNPLDEFDQNPGDKCTYLVSDIEINNPSDSGEAGLQVMMPSVESAKPESVSHAVNMEIVTCGIDNSAFNSNGEKEVSSIENFHLRRNCVNMEWKNITLKTKKGDVILKGLSGSICSGELTAIMGPSGAGKTSLLNVLSGFTKHKVSGQVLVNGSNRDMRVFRKLICYILQEDHLLPRLTVRELVTIAANLKTPATVPEHEKLRDIDDCLTSLGLISHQNQRVNTLSGGQRKRLSIAQELVSNPPVIFLDEPTSGLDSSSCLQCIQLLKSLAEKGLTVICTIHQPSSKIFEIFDKLYMLAGGQCIYRGSKDDLVPFLAQQGLHCPRYHNPTDYVTEVAMGVYGDWNKKLIKAIDARDGMSRNCSDADLETSSRGTIFKKSVISFFRSLGSATKEEQQGLDSRQPNGYVTSSFNQFSVLFKRNVICKLREPMDLQFKLFCNVLVGLLLGVCFYKIGDDATMVFKNAGLIFWNLSFIIFMGKIPTTLTFPMERMIFEREHMNQWYSTRMYYLARIVADLPFQIILPSISCSILYWMSGQISDIFRFSLFLLSVILTSLISQSFGQFIGAGSDVQRGVYIACVTSFPILLFSGFFIALNTIPWYLRWLSYCSFATYALQSMVLSVYSMDRVFLTCMGNGTFCPFEDPKTIIAELNMNGDLYVDYSALLGFLLFFKIATYLVLNFRVSWMR